MAELKHKINLKAMQLNITLMFLNGTKPAIFLYTLLYAVFLSEIYKQMILFKKKRVELGDGHIIQYTVFESKYFGGIWIYNWKTIGQNRFHTHAFNSIAITLSGSYEQEVIKNGEIKKEVVISRFTPRYLPKNYCHRILKASPKTWTLVFFGKWIPYWWEYFQDTKTWVKYTWGRKVVEKRNGDETMVL